MAKYSERRAPDRASKAISQGSTAMEATGSAVAELQREIAQTIALVMELGRQYDQGIITAEREREIWDWAASAAGSFQKVVADLQAVNANLSCLVTPAKAA